MSHITKYRVLNDKELTELEKEFTQFLIIQGIDDEKWRKINHSEKEKAINLVEVFSNTVFEKVYSKIEYLEYKSSDFFSIFKILDQETLVLRISQQKKGFYDFSKDSELKESIQKRKYISIKKGMKKHGKEKLMEIHQLITQGCVVSTKNMWEYLNKSI